MKLSERLTAIAHLIPPGTAVADVGTDHAYLPIYLVRNGISRKVIATEVREGPFERARANVKKAGLEEFIEVRLGYGLTPLRPGEAEVAVIAGMGGETIWSIIEKSPDIVNSLSAVIVQPMRYQPKLRKALMDHGFNFIEERVVKSEDRFYEIIVVRKGDPVSYDEIDVLVGPVLKKKKTPEVLGYIKARLDRLFYRLKELEGRNTISAANARESLMREIELLREVYENAGLPDGDKYHREAGAKETSPGMG
ncbi:tRNA (adenine(22)-N(1))-methyltransferase [Thermosediminibacter litoriperuensis]|uniref:tRNA (Adenine22-N1)-methyltransferase n=1 Tax=Thermosediminibacter litoriperuensis TaxID=291989 RepID=A0A5S5ASE1_9FIRM|nr:class I SAM-dependent methyltransferase [Thermosediminibacter litoriperuensis]TYP54961.1 tRNA (adenine22-N1)-methyltransferase [Thermosediminibacter litoriperuensis]